MPDFVASNTEYMEGKLKILWFQKITNVKEVHTVLPIALYLESKKTEENGKKKWTVLFSCLLEKKDRAYNSVNNPEIFALEIELFALVVRV